MAEKTKLENSIMHMSRRVNTAFWLSNWGLKPAEIVAWIGQLEEIADARNVDKSRVLLS